MLAGTTGTRGSARGRMTLLAAAVGLIAGLLLAGASHRSTVLSGLFCLAGAAAGCVVISDVVSGATRREGGRGGGLAFLVSLAAPVVVAAPPRPPPPPPRPLPPRLCPATPRQRRAKRKHAGLRVLR